MDAISSSAFPNAQERAYQFVKAAIINLELQTDQKLRAQDIAERLQLSRTPVREAFGRLEQEGLIVRGSGWGYAVRGLSVKEALDVYRVREALEVEAVREIVPKFSPELFTFLHTHLQRAEESMRAGRIDEYRRSTRSFYRDLVQATENGLLAYMYSLIDDRIQWLGALVTDRHLSRPRESLPGNREVLQALERRDEQAATDAVRKHIAGARKSFLDHVTSEGSSLYR
jgi:DNA-binding GntR family transcriptional regulator